MENLDKYITSIEDTEDDDVDVKIVEEKPKKKGL